MICHPAPLHRGSGEVSARGLVRDAPLGGAVQARPRLESVWFQTLIVKKDKSAFNLTHDGFLSLRRYASERRAALTKVFEAMKSDKEALAQLLTMEQGKPLEQARSEVDTSVKWMREAAMDLTKEMDLAKVISDDGEKRIEVHLRPVVRRPCVSIIVEL